MSIVEFTFNGIKTLIQCNSKDTFKNIIQKFIIKIGKNINNLYFLYSGEIIKEELTFNELVNKEDKKRDKMCIIALEAEEDNSPRNNNKKSKYIICPECKENIRLGIYNDKITLYECINNHIFKNLSLKEFGTTQNIDESKIYCGNCSITKNKTYKNSFNICYSCKLNLYPICTYSHNKTHKIIDYDLKTFICNKHYESFLSFCEQFKKDICLIYENAHKDHKVISYEAIIPNVDKIKKEIQNFKDKIDEYKDYIDEIIDKLNNLMDFFDTYYQIYKHIINNYENKNKNFAVLKNMEDINVYIKDSMNKIDTIIKETNVKISFSKLIDIYMGRCEFLVPVNFSLNF